MNISMTIGVILIAMAWSFFYKENPFYRFAEHTLVGAVLGNGVIVGVLYLENSVFTPLSNGAALMILPILLGLMMFSRLSRKASLLSRVPMAVVLGTGIGVGTRAAMSVTVIGQTQAAMAPILGIDQIVAIVCVVTTLLYFIYSREQRGPFGAVSRFGRWMLMVLFGAYFGTVILTRYAYTTGRVVYILRALGLLP